MKLHKNVHLYVSRNLAKSDWIAKGHLGKTLVFLNSTLIIADVGVGRNTTPMSSYFFRGFLKYGSVFLIPASHSHGSSGLYRLLLINKVDCKKNSVNGLCSDIESMHAIL